MVVIGGGSWILPKTAETGIGFHRGESTPPRIRATSRGHLRRPESPGGDMQHPVSPELDVRSNIRFAGSPPSSPDGC
jgi:hypothetical protein